VCFTPHPVLAQHEHQAHRPLRPAASSHVRACVRHSTGWTGRQACSCSQADKTTPGGPVLPGGVQHQVALLVHTLQQADQHAAVGERHLEGAGGSHTRGEAGRGSRQATGTHPQRLLQQRMHRLHRRTLCDCCHRISRVLRRWTPRHRPRERAAMALAAPQQLHLHLCPAPRRRGRAGVGVGPVARAAGGSTDGVGDDAQDEASGPSPPPPGRPRWPLTALETAYLAWLGASCSWCARPWPTL
jgi:hypothetical protein